MHTAAFASAAWCTIAAGQLWGCGYFWRRYPGVRWCSRLKHDGCVKMPPGKLPSPLDAPSWYRSAALSLGRRLTAKVPAPIDGCWMLATATTSAAADSQSSLLWAALIAHRRGPTDERRPAAASSRMRLQRHCGVGESGSGVPGPQLDGNPAWRRCKIKIACCKPIGGGWSGALRGRRRDGCTGGGRQREEEDDDDDEAAFDACVVTLLTKDRSSSEASRRGMRPFEP